MFIVFVNCNVREHDAIHGIERKSDVLNIAPFNTSMNHEIQSCETDHSIISHLKGLPAETDIVI